MKKLTIGLPGVLAYTARTTVYAAKGDRGDRIENRFDRHN